MKEPKMKKSRSTPEDDWRKRYREILKTRRLRLTPQRVAIGQTLLTAQDEHLTVEEICGRVNEGRSRVGQATVYRTVRLLEEFRLVLLHRFAGGVTRVEPILRNAPDHAHLICSLCGTIQELPAESFRRSLNNLATKAEFAIQNQSIVLHGLCKDCRWRG